MRPKLIDISVEGNCISILYCLLMIICLGACSPKHSSYSEFASIPSYGWVKTEPCEFIPQFVDSTSVYDVEVAFCYEHAYSYRNMSMVVDFIKTDSLINRKVINCVLADETGNMQSAGFGVAYQAKLLATASSSVGEFDKIRIWQGLDCDTLKGISRIGVLIHCTE